MASTTEMTSFGVQGTDETTGWIAANLSVLDSNRSGQDSDPYYDVYDPYFYVRRILTITCYASTMVVGTLGNLIVVYTIWRCRHLHTVMYALLASLAGADLLMLVVVLPWRLNIFLNNLYGPWPYGDFICRFQVYVHLLSAVSTVFHLTVISVERCYAVMFPLKSRTVLTMGNAYKIIAFVWTAALAMSIPSVFGVATHSYQDPMVGPEPFDICENNWPSKTSLRAYFIYQFFLVFGIPMVIITAAYVFILKTLCARRVPTEHGDHKSGAIAMSQSRKFPTGASSRNGASTKTGSVYVANGTQKLNRKSARNKEAEIRQLTVMLVVVIVAFTISWGPLVTLTVCKSFKLFIPSEEPWLYIDLTFHLLSFTNSAANPIIYALVSASFRQSCFWALKVCCKSRKVRRRPSNMSRATTVSRVGVSNGGGGSSAVDNVSMSSVCVQEKN